MRRYTLYTKSSILFEKSSCYRVQIRLQFTLESRLSLNLMTLLPQLPPECWDYRQGGTLLNLNVWLHLSVLSAWHLTACQSTQCIRNVQYMLVELNAMME